MKAFRSILLVAISLYFSAAFAGKAPLYKIEKNGQTAYLLGTIHTGVDFNDLPETAKYLAQTSDSLVIETDLEAAGPLMARAFPLGEKNSLKSQLGWIEWRKLYSRVSPLLPRENMQVLDRVDPVIANLYLMLVSFEQVENPIDATLLQNAKNARKNVFFFEAPEEQIEVLRKTQNIKSLKKMLAMSKRELAHSSDSLVQAYITNNGPLIAKIMESTTSPEDLQIVLKNRNANWMKNFGPLFAHSGTEFFAVGAGHLYGNYGLLELLSAQGYRVSPLE